MQDQHLQSVGQEMDRPSTTNPSLISDVFKSQFVMDEREYLFDKNVSIDPLCEESHSPVKGLIHKHPNRAVLLLTSECLAYCRFCTRKRWVGKGWKRLSSPERDRILAYLDQHKNLHEIILSGGDPLVLEDEELASWARDLKGMRHIKWLRLGTRAPIIKPDRVTDSLVKRLLQYQPLYWMIHVNHPDELAAGARSGIQKLVDQGFVILSQTVLLKGLNDRVDILQELMTKLVTLRVRPYYIYVTDHVAGTRHFWVSESEARVLQAALSVQCSGLELPSFVVDGPDGKRHLAVSLELDHD